MLNKKELISSFVNGSTSGQGSNLYIDGNRLVNYSTVIAIRTDKGIILNCTKYSMTTSRNQNLIRYYGNVIQELDCEQFYDFMYK